MSGFEVVNLSYGVSPWLSAGSFNIFAVHNRRFLFSDIILNEHAVIKGLQHAEQEAKTLNLYVSIRARLCNTYLILIKSEEKLRFIA